MWGLRCFRQLIKTCTVHETVCIQPGTEHSVAILYQVVSI